MNEEKILELANTLKKDGNIWFTNKDKEIFIENTNDKEIGFSLNIFRANDKISQQEVIDFNFALVSRTLKCDTEIEAICLSINQGK